MFKRADELKQFEAPDLSTVYALIGEIDKLIDKKNYDKALELTNKAEEVILRIKGQGENKYSPQYLYDIFETIELTKEGLKSAMVKKE
jgi:hypothetical protein